MATRRAKKEKVARTQVRRTVEERNLENRRKEERSVIDNNNKHCRSPLKSYLENLRIRKCERFWRTSDNVRRELQKLILKGAITVLEKCNW